MAINYVRPGIPFSIEMSLNDVNQIETDLHVFLKLLSSFFSSLNLRSAKISPITHSSTEYNLVESDFVYYGPYSFSSKSISLHNHGPNPILWNGILQLKEINCHQMDTLLHNISTAIISSNDLQIGLIWRFSDDSSSNFKKLIAVNQGDYKLQNARLNAKSFSLGNMINGYNFVTHFKSNLSENHALSSIIKPISDIQVDLLHTKRHMELQFFVCSLHPRSYEFQEFKLRFDYKSIKEVTVCSNKITSSMNLYFHLSNPPKILTREKNLDRKIVSVSKSCKRDQWTRWHDCFLIPADMIGKQNVLKLTIDTSTNEKFQAPLSSLYVWRRYSPLDISFSCIRETSFLKHQETTSIDLPFEVSYAIECIKSLGNSFYDDLELNNGGDLKLKQFIHCQIEAGKTKQIIEALYRLFFVYQTRKVYHAFEYLKFLYNQVLDDWVNIQNLGDNSSTHVKYLRRCILTPTRVLLFPPSPFQSSFFSETVDAEYILRALVRDVDDSYLGYAIAKNDDDHQVMTEKSANKLLECRDYFLKEVIEKRLLDGLCVADRLYQYFGASMSQFREAGMILYAEDLQGRNAKMLRSSFGDIDEKSVPKYSARLGLNLSQVMAFVELPASTQILMCPDIHGGCHSQTEKPYNFTDGCGSISQDLARYTWDKMTEHKDFKSNQVTIMPSAFQIRFMGAKGMVCIDSNLKGMVIVIRKSMLKMNGLKKELGILKIGEPRRAYLNSPLITILNQIGLSNHFFVKLLMTVINKLIGSFDKNKDAISVLKKFSSLHRFVDYEKLAAAGFRLNYDPFFRDILTLVFNQGLDVIKRKGRIPLPMKDARTMFGLADPTVNPFCPAKEVKFTEKNVCIPPEIEPCFDALGKGLLKRGEVFVWPSDFDKPCVGELIVTKFPSTHPGDVRRLVAKDHRELHLIRDCIVFPVDGNRPHSDEMAGSDLDGDEYCVIWANEFKRIQISEPMEYPAGSYESNCENITEKEMINFHMQYLKDCAYGRIAKAHLAWADLTSIISDRCLDLAEKYAGALDFAKQGINKNHRFGSYDRYPEAPDFMEKHESKPAYHSTRALGAIYQIISQFQLYLADEIKVKQMIEPYIDHRLRHPQWKLYEESARAAHTKYETRIEYILQRCEFSSETELLSQIFEKNCVFRRSPDEGARSNDHQDSVVSIVKNILVQEMDEDFERNLSHVPESHLSEARVAKASAYYIVTINKFKQSKLKCLGLPWIGNHCQYLLQLLAKNAKAMLKGPLLVQNGPRFYNVEEKYWQKTRRKLFYWVDQLYKMTNISEQQRTYLEEPMREILNYTKRFYFSIERKHKCSVLLKIFDKVQNFPVKLRSDRVRGLFSGYNNPIGQLVIALLEQELSNSVKETANDLVELFTNRCFMVHVSVKRSGSGISVERLVKLLKTLISDAEITELEPKMIHYTPIAVYASPTSLLVAQIVVGIHNRLCSSRLYY